LRSTLDRWFRILPSTGSFWMKRHLPAPYFFTPLRSASSSSGDHCVRRFDGIGVSAIGNLGRRGGKDGASGTTRGRERREKQASARTLVLGTPMINEAGGRRALVVAPRLTQWRRFPEAVPRSKIGSCHFQRRDPRSVIVGAGYRARTTVYHSPFSFSHFSLTELLCINKAIPKLQSRWTHRCRHHNETTGTRLRLQPQR